MGSDGTKGIGGLASGYASAAMASAQVRAGQAAQAGERLLSLGRHSISNSPSEPGRNAKEVESAATDFEALIMQEMLKSMWGTVQGDGLLTGSREEALYRDFLNQELARNIAQNQSLGFKELIANDINKMQAKKK